MAALIKNEDDEDCSNKKVPNLSSSRDFSPYKKN